MQRSPEGEGILSGAVPVGSRFRGQGAAAWGTWGRGALRPALALSRRLGSRLRRNDGRLCKGLIGEGKGEGGGARVSGLFWIPAYAGMTVTVAGWVAVVIIAGRARREGGAGRVARAEEPPDMLARALARGRWTATTSSSARATSKGRRSGAAAAFAGTYRREGEYKQGHMSVYCYPLFAGRLRGPKLALRLSMMHTREAPRLPGKDSVRRFGYLAALSAPWLALLGFLAYGSRRFLLDDAFISFRYVRNLLEGNGLVWNPGERVEGYSNFLWVLELAGIWAVTGVPPEDTVWWLSAAFTVATLAAVAWWTWRLPGIRSRALVWWMALGFLCASATFAKWTSGGGLETRQFTFFVVLAVVALTAHRGSRRGLLVASFSLALASLTRPEGPLIAAGCFAWWAAQGLADGERGNGRERSGGVKGWAVGLARRIDWRGALALAPPFALIVGTHFLWRYSYYGEWLPNTYYAKYVRPWWDIGLQYLAAAAVETGLYLLLPLGAGAAWMRWRERRDLAYGLPLLTIALHAAYLARVGGDGFGWRMLDFYWPLLALPAADGLRGAGSALGRALRRRMVGARAADGRLWAVALFLPALIYAGAIQGALFRDTFHRTPDSAPLTEWSPGWIPPAPGMPALVALSSNLRETIMSRWSGLRQGPVLARSQLSKWEVYENMERGLIPDDAVALVKFAGVKPYYLPDLTFVDYYGLSDWVIARNPVAVPNSERLFAHDRFPPPGYLEERVNFNIFPAARGVGAALSAAPYAAQFAHGLWMPFDAPSTEWAESRFDSFVTPEDLRTFAQRYGRLAADSEFDVYAAPASDSPVAGGRRTLAYVREPCAEEDVRAKFFLHLFPADENDLPEDRREWGFDNLDFAFADWGLRQGERCVAVRRLPDYSIDSVATGQFTSAGSIWEAEFALPDDGRE